MGGTDESIPRDPFLRAKRNELGPFLFAACRRLKRKAKKRPRPLIDQPELTDTERRRLEFVDYLRTTQGAYDEFNIE